MRVFFGKHLSLPEQVIFPSCPTNVMSFRYEAKPRIDLIFLNKTGANGLCEQKMVIATVLLEIQSEKILKKDSFVKTTTKPCI